MIAELGVLALVCALMFSGLLVMVPWIGLRRQNARLCQAAITYVWGQSACVLLAFVCLTVCFLRDDFSVVYVLANASRSLPWYYKLCAVWGGHEGSMLLWVLILNAWMLALTFWHQAIEDAFFTRVLMVLGGLNLGFLLFLLLTSNPFLRQFHLAHPTGRDLNPLLQDPGFLFHPPMLYMGYVGFSVAFAFAIAALWMGRMDSVWIRWMRPWTLAAWCFLTLGITLGSWWAYRELGWGGWWFWDPVENASFMPWLVGTALIHAAMVSEKRQHLMGWTLLLAVSAFSLSLIGTFLVRSGVLTSVHAFAVDPARGLYILSFLAVVIGGSFVLFALRAHQLMRVSYAAFFSRESLLLLNNVLLMVMMLTVLLGTVYPLLIDGLGLGKLSVGAPYFNQVFVPLALPVIFLMGLGVHVRWKTDTFWSVAYALRGVGLLMLLVLLSLWWVHAKVHSVVVLLGIGFGAWLLLATIFLLYQRIVNRGLFKVGLGFWAMIAAHVGVAVSVLGISVSTGFGQHQDVKMAPGDTLAFASMKIQFVRETPLHGPNYKGTRATFRVTQGTRDVLIYPEKRVYTVARMAMTESAIDVSPWRDVYIALGEPIGERAWSVRIYNKPWIRWIWAGGLLMFFGGFLGMWAKRPWKIREQPGVKTA